MLPTCCDCHRAPALWPLLQAAHRPPSFRFCARRLCSRVLGFPNRRAPNKRIPPQDENPAPVWAPARLARLLGCLASPRLLASSGSPRRRLGRQPRQPARRAQPQAAGGRFRFLFQQEVNPGTQGTGQLLVLAVLHRSPHLLSCRARTRSSLIALRHKPVQGGENKKQKSINSVAISFHGMLFGQSLWTPYGAAAEVLLSVVEEAVRLTGSASAFYCWLHHHRTAVL